MYWMHHSPVVDFSRARPSAQLLLRLLSFSPGCFRPHCVSEMPRQRGKSKRGSAWQPSQPHLALCPSPAPSHSSSSSSPSSSSSLAQSSHSLALSSSFAYRLEWLDFSGTSLGFHPGPLGDLASASQSVPVAPPNSPARSPSQSPHALLLGAHSEGDGHEASQGSLQRPHSRADSWADPESELQIGLALLKSLVFELRRDLDDLRFRLEILDRKATQFLQFLSTLQDAHHPSAGEAHAAEAKPPVLAPAPPLGTSENATTVNEEDAPPVLQEDTMQEDTTPVEEEPAPLGDPTLGATSMDAWSHYSPTT